MTMIPERSPKMKPYQMLNGRWIDLESIISISKIQTKEIFGDTYSHFEINCQFHERSILIGDNDAGIQEDEIIFLRIYNQLIEAWKNTSNPKEET